MPTKNTPVTETSTANKRSRPAASSGPLPFAPRVPARPFVDLEEVPGAATEPPPTLQKVQENYQAPAKQSASNALGDPTQNLQNFTLTDLAPLTREATYSSNASKDVHLFYVGRDDVHDILKYILSRVTISLYVNMFGFDDAELNNILMEKALNPGITMLITLDKSQAGGVHEKALVDADEKYNLAAYNTHFVVGQSATHQISHTKGFVADGRVAAEGSTNWSSSGEGTFLVTGQAGGRGYKAQNNTQSVITDPDTIVRFQTELIAEHMIAQSAAKGTDKKVSNNALALTPTPATAALQNQIMQQANASIRNKTARRRAASTRASGNVTGKVPAKSRHAGLQ